MPTLRLLPLEYWRNLRVGSKLEPLNQAFEVGLIDAAAQVAEVGKDLPAGQVGVERRIRRAGSR